MATKPSNQVDFETITLIASELSLPAKQVRAAIELLQAGNTIPFVARYRKETTGGLDEIVLREIEDLYEKANALAARKATVLKTIDKQGLLTDALRRQIEKCANLQALEVLYLPFKPKRRTRALIARERGLGPLGERILAQPDDGDPRGEAAAFVDPEKGVEDVEAALAGARDIAAEAVAVEPGAAQLKPLGASVRDDVHAVERTRVAREGVADLLDAVALRLEPDHIEAAAVRRALEQRVDSVDESHGHGRHQEYQRNP